MGKQLIQVNYTELYNSEQEVLKIIDLLEKLKECLDEGADTVEIKGSYGEYFKMECYSKREETDEEYAERLHEKKVYDARMQAQKEASDYVQFQYLKAKFEPNENPIARNI